MRIDSPYLERRSRLTWLHLNQIVRARTMLALAGLILLAALHVTLARQGGLWQDEIFSLSMATGHSLEHSESLAQVDRGDFLAPTDVTTATDLRRFAEHRSPLASPFDVVRAVYMSDTSPPLYYLLLYGWTLLFGTGDLALRLMSIVFGLLSIPLVWALAGRIGGQRVALVASTLFALAPTGIYYAVEGRMYSVLWFFSIAAVLLTLNLNERGYSPSRVGLWVASAVCGMLTHYVFAFVLAACVVWLLWSPGVIRRWPVMVAATASLAIVAPWYVLTPRMLSAWRVTQEWIQRDSPGFEGFSKLFSIPIRWFVQGGFATNVAMLALIALAGLTLLWYERWGLFRGTRLLLLLCLAGALGGLVVLDLLRGTYLSIVVRYSLTALPFAAILLALGVNRLRPLLQAGILAALLILFFPVTLEQATGRGHSFPPVDAAEFIDSTARQGDLVVIEGIPSQMTSLSRYIESDVPVMAWMKKSENPRPTDDLDQLTADYNRLIVVHFPWWDEPSVLAGWLEGYGQVIETMNSGDIEVGVYAPAGATGNR